MEKDRARRPLFELDEVPQAAKIKVIGLGGGGGNAVSRMMAAQFTGVDFIVANTDMQALRASPAPVKIQLGAKLTQGLGAGSNPDVGRNAALEDSSRVRTWCSSRPGSAGAPAPARRRSSPRSPRTWAS
jgi:cell division GTPase FtsZ